MFLRAQPTSGANKRCFFLLNICFIPKGEKPRLTVIFWGKVQRITAILKEAWNKDVDIHFQTNAWAETNFCIDSAERTLKPAVETNI